MQVRAAVNAWPHVVQPLTPGINNRLHQNTNLPPLEFAPNRSWQQWIWELLARTTLQKHKVRLHSAKATH